MGFWKKIGRAIGRAVEKTGDFLRIEKLSDIGVNIQNLCAEKVGKEKSYEKDKANIYSTERMNEILVSFSEGYFKQATIIENECIEIVEHYYNSLINMIEDSTELAYNKANLKALKKEKARIGKSITGAIKDPLAKRMSLDDSECLKILKMNQGSEKVKAMSAFSQKVISEALDNLAKKVRDTMSEQLTDIEDYLINVSEEQEKEFSNLKVQFEKMCCDGKLETGEREKHCVGSLLIIDATEVVQGILG